MAVPATVVYFTAYDWLKYRMGYRENDPATRFVPVLAGSTARSKFTAFSCLCEEYGKFELDISWNHFIAARVAKRAKVMFSQACVTHSVQLGGGGGGATNTSWDRSHGQEGRCSCPGVCGPVWDEGGHPPPPGQDHPPPPPTPWKERSLTSHPLPFPTYGHYGLCAGGRYASCWNAFLFEIYSFTAIDLKYIIVLETSASFELMHLSSLSVGAATIITPLEMVRTKMQSEKLSYGQVGVALRHSIQEGGLRSLMLGLGPTLLRDLPFSGLPQFQSSLKNQHAR